VEAALARLSFRARRGCGGRGTTFKAQIAEITAKQARNKGRADALEKAEAAWASSAKPLDRGVC
jgi:hypothetical protein